MTMGFRKKIFYMPEGEGGGGSGEAAADESGESSESAAPAGESGESSSESSKASGLLADAGKGNSTPADDSKAEGEAAADTSEHVRPRPENVSEQFWDTEKGEVKVDTLANSYNDARKEINRLNQAKGGEAPEKAEDYLVDYKPPHRARGREGKKEGDVLDRYGELDSGDPVFLAMAQFAKQGNMSPGQFTDGMQELMETLHPILPEVFNPEKEKAILGEGAEHMIQTNRDWIDTLAKNGVVNEDEFNLLLGFGSTALGVQLTNKLRLNSGEKPIPVNLNGGANKGRKSPDECAAMMEDERYAAPGPAGDAFRLEVDKAFAETYGTETA